MPPLTCQYPEGFCWLTNHPKPRVGKLTNDKFGKDVLKRSSEEANWLKINKDSVQSHWSPWKKKWSIKNLRNPIGWLCNLFVQWKTNQTGFLPWCATVTPWKNIHFCTQFSSRNAGNRILGLWNFNIFWGSMPPDPPWGTGLLASCQYSRVLYSNLLATSVIIETPGLSFLYMVNTQGDPNTVITACDLVSFTVVDFWSNCMKVLLWL